MKKTTLTVLFLSTLTSSVAVAGGPPPPTYSLVPGTGEASKTETRAYAGLNWKMDGGIVPALVIGAFRAKVDSDGDTSGGNLAFHLNLAGGAKPGKLKLGYLNGREDLQGEIGIGYDFLKQAPLLGLAVNVPYISVGVDAYTDASFVPYGTLHTQGEFDKPNPATADQCVVDAGGSYSDASCTTPIVL